LESGGREGERGRAVKRWQLAQRQSLPLEAKVVLSKLRIREWYDYWGGNVYVSFSGGKDSTVLLHLVRSMFPEIPAMFVDTGLEYPEIREFVRTVDNVAWVKPELSYRQVIERHGYPVVSKVVSMGVSRYRNTSDDVQKELRLHGGTNPSSGKAQRASVPKCWHHLCNAPFAISERCCDVLKKQPAHRYGRENNNSKPYLAMMASDSNLRRLDYLKHEGKCNTFDSGQPKSHPLSPWLEEDIWVYLYKYRVPYSKIYNIGERRTGCIFCCFGVHMEKPTNRFQRMKLTHPKLYTHCMEELGIREVLEYMGVAVE